MDAETNERLRRLSRYGDDLGAALEVLRESERRGWTDAPLLDFGGGDPERWVDKVVLAVLRSSGPCMVDFTFEDHGIAYRPPHLSHVGRKEVRLHNTQEGWLGHLWMLSLSRLDVVYVCGPITLGPARPSIITACP